MKLVACVSVGLVAAVLPLVAMARPELAQGQKVVYSWNYESDSGYADTNECVQNIFSAQGKLLSNTIVHDFVAHRGTENVFCADIARNQSKTYGITYDAASSEFYCHRETTSPLGGVDRNYASEWLCGI